MNVVDSSAWLEYFALESKLPMADSIVLATARAYGAVLWTQDDDFRGIPGVQYRRRRP